MKKNYLVSVIMPVFNGESYVREAIESVLNQSYTNFEFIIMNDGSTDKSESIVRSFQDERIKLINNPVNIGLVKTLNLAISHCKGEFIARFDSDDICMQNRLEKQLKQFSQNSTLDVVGSTANIIDSCGHHKGLFKVPEEHTDIHLGMLFNNQIIHPTVMIRRKSILKYMPNVYDVKDQHVEDYGLWVKMLSNHQFYNIQVPLIKYRVHDTKISTIYSKSQIENSKKIKSTISKFYSVNPDVTETHRLYLRDSSLSLQDANERIFTRLNDDFYSSMFVSRIFWEAALKERIKGRRSFSIYHKSAFRKKAIWYFLLLLSPLIVKLPEKFFEKRLRIFGEYR